MRCFNAFFIEWTNEFCSLRIWNQIIKRTSTPWDIWKQSWWYENILFLPCNWENNSSLCHQPTSLLISKAKINVLKLSAWLKTNFERRKIFYSLDLVQKSLWGSYCCLTFTRWKAKFMVASTFLPHISGSRCLFYNLISESRRAEFINLINTNKALKYCISKNNMI